MPATTSPLTISIDSGRDIPPHSTEIITVVMRIYTNVTVSKLTRPCSFSRLKYLDNPENNPDEPIDKLRYFSQPCDLYQAAVSFTPCSKSH